MYLRCVRATRAKARDICSTLPARRVDRRRFTGVFHESLLHSRYIWLKSNRGLRASRSRRCEIMAPATMAGPTKGKEGCLGTVGEA